MYYCKNCYEEFEEPKYEKECFEDFYGVGNLFHDRHYFEKSLCPYCGEDDFEEMKKCDVCEEWTKEDDLIDTDGLVGGGTGYVCPQCARDCEIGGV